jgi:uncharacterized cupredoxin-like copper-binding protein
LKGELSMKNDLKRSEKKHENSFKVKKYELRKIFKKLEMSLFNDKLVIDGEEVMIPRNAQINYKVRFENDDKYELTIKIGWKKDRIPSVTKNDEDD